MFQFVMFALAKLFASLADPTCSLAVYLRLASVVDLAVLVGAGLFVPEAATALFVDVLALAAAGRGEAEGAGCGGAFF